MTRKHFVNEKYFENVETEKQAYILGFIYADGCVQKLPTTSGLTIEQLAQDVDILYQIKYVLESTYPFLERVQSTNGKHRFRFYVYSKKLCSDLEKLGVVQRKSLILKFPFFIKDELLPHFIRGYFDGDGCIWNGKRKTMVVKDKARKNGFRKRIVHNVKFSFTGYDGFISDLQNVLCDSIGIKKNKLNYSKAKDTRNNTSENVCTFECSGRGNIKKLYEYMYKDATIYGKRKFDKFNEILCAFGGKSPNETGLIAGNPLES